MEHTSQSCKHGRIEGRRRQRLAVAGNSFIEHVAAAISVAQLPVGIRCHLPRVRPPRLCRRRNRGTARAALSAGKRWFDGRLPKHGRPCDFKAPFDTHLQVERRKRRPCQSVIRYQPQRLAEALLCSLIEPLDAQQLAHAHVHVDESRVKKQCGTMAIERQRVGALRHVSRGQVGVRRRVVWVQSDGLEVVLERQVQVPYVTQCVCHVEVGLGHGWL
mmetsp:Transcript_11625/g.48896  ORF Transcript_11625/g.48896 Transcript_11625/m.48896 type:complete len:217 (+) Transcript_11625:3694-4344(+)